MRNLFKKKIHSQGLVLLALISAMLFSCSVKPDINEANNPEITNQNLNNEYDTDKFADVPDTLQSRTKFISSLVNITNGGLRFDIDYGTLSFTSSDSSKTGENVIDFQGTTGVLCLDGFSVHDLKVCLDAPISYNGISRELALTLSDDELYFRIANIENNQDKYDFAYKASLESADTTINNQSIDPVTGGVYWFEYGNLDSFIHDILETLTQSSDIEDPVSVSSELEEESTSVFNTSKLFASFDSIVETRIGGKPYFSMEIENNDNTYTIGFLTENDYSLSRVDFPAINNGIQDECTLKDNLKLKLQASITSANTLPSFVVEDAANYRDITDSTALFKKIAKYINLKKFNVEADINFIHKEAAITDPDKTNHPAVDETVNVTLNSSINLSSNNIDDLGALATLKSFDGSNNLKYSQFLNLFYDKSSAEANDANNEYLINYNDIAQVKTSKTVVDAIFENLSAILDDENIHNENLSDLISLADYVFKGIEAITDSSLVTNMKEGKYHDILDMVTTLVNGNNYLKVELSLANAGLEGSVVIELKDVSESGPLVVITFPDGVALHGSSEKATLGIRGEIKVVPYNKVQNNYDVSSYVEMSHLEGVSDQLRLLTKSTRASFTLRGYILKDKLNDVGTSQAFSNITEPKYNNKTLQGFTFNGNFAFDLLAKKGAGSVVFTDRKEEYRNDHTLKIDIEGDEVEGETDDENTANFNNMLFEYNSKNVNTTLKSKSASGYDSGYTYTDSDGKTRTEPHKSAMKGRFSIHSLNGILDVVRSFQDQDDGRLNRLFSLLSNSNSLLSEILDRQYATLLTRPMIHSIQIGSNNVDTILIEPWVAGSDGYITVKIGFDSSYDPESSDQTKLSTAGIKSLIISLATGGDSDGSNKKHIYLELDVTKVLGENEQIQMNFAGQSKSNFSDYSSFKQLGQYALDTFYLGLDTADFSTYHINGSATLSASIFGNFNIRLDFYLWLKGSEIYLYGLIDVDCVYLLGYGNFDDNHSTMKHYSSIFAHFTGNSDTDKVILQRVDYYTTMRMLVLNYHNYRTYTEKMTSAHFKDNLLQWLLKFMLGFNNKTYDAMSLDEASPSSLHGEDMITSFTYNSSDKSWNIGLGVDALAHSSALSTLNAKLGTKALSNGKRVLYSLATTESMSIVSILGVTFSITIKNLETGTYKNCYDNTSYKATYYKPTNSTKNKNTLTISGTDTFKNIMKTYFTNNTSAVTNSTPYAYK
ncbi:MAG: hypothetical protein SPL02_02875 [Bacilli bacterium]|nr:hypothetical protein [Bacilli bacterium]MDY6430842.1 hypothetical protein [Bacilli bacterium]